MVKPMDFIWMDGKLVPWHEANVHVMTHTLHYGDGLFEGIRAYKCVDGRSAIFRLGSHIHRLFNSAFALKLKIPYTPLELEQAVLETAKANKFEEGYIRPLVLVGEGDMGPLPHNNPIQVIIITWEWGHYMGQDALNNGISVKVSKWIRDNRVLPFYAKVCGHYVNAGLAKREAEEAGFEEAILLDPWDNVIEGSAENIFIVKDGILMTPKITLPILRGITRDTVIYLARDIGITVDETMINLKFFYGADEAFYTGTAAEITPIKDVEKSPIGKVCPGSVTKKLQELYFKTVRGEIPAYQNKWLTYI